MSAVHGRFWLVQLICLLSLSGLSSGALAARVSHLYQQTIPIESQSDQDRIEAMGQALTDVLFKVTGQRSTLNNPEVRAAIQKPAPYVQGFSYYQGEEGGRNQQYITINFDPSSVNQLLRKADLAIWGASRPTTLLWLAVEDNDGRQLLNATSPLPQVMSHHFENRAVPVILPLLDFEDANNISVVDVWGGFSDKLEKASERYGAEAILSGRLTKKNERYNGRLTLLFRNQRYTADVNDLVSAGVASLASDLVSGTLAKHYAVKASEFRETPLLVIQNIKSLEDYVALTQYLNKQTAIRDIIVTSLQDDRIELELSIDGSTAQLNDTLALSHALTAAPGPDAPPEELLVTEQTKLYYRWSDTQVP